MTSIGWIFPKGKIIFTEKIIIFSPSKFQGLEGRSTNPVSILFDALSHPDADLGDDKPSLLNWQYRQDLKVDHVVLGKGCPGGAWKVKFKSKKTYSIIL